MLGRVWVWLGMERKNGRMVWFDNTPAELSEGALYNAWNSGEPNNNNGNEGNLGGNGAPYVLCQRARYLKNDLS